MKFAYGKEKLAKLEKLSTNNQLPDQQGTEK